MLLAATPSACFEGLASPAATWSASRSEVVASVGVMPSIRWFNSVRLPV